MEKHIELSKRLVVSRRRDGRCIYDAEAKQELIRACLRPGVSIARLAMEHGVNANLLRTWVACYQREHSGTVESSRAESEAEASSAFMAVEIETVTANVSPLSPLPVIHSPNDVAQQLSSTVSTQTAKAKVSIRLQVRLPNGVGFDISEAEVEALLPVMEMLGRLPCSDSTIR